VEHHVNSVLQVRKTTRASVLQTSQCRLCGKTISSPQRPVFGEEN